jgi:pimeloyl-ACP methyl ester carboxylesterase
MKQLSILLFATLSVMSALASASDSSNFILKTATGSIYGTLETPANKGKVPVILIIAGSGPTDRNGNALKLGLNTNIYLQLADSLALHGIASLRYDKRGIGASAAAMKSESDIRFDHYIDDAIGFIKMLRADQRFSRIIVFGHSEGSLIGMIAAGRASADAYISAAGAGDRIDKIIENQLAAQSAPLAAKATILFDSLSKGLTVQDPGNGLSSLFHASVQPYLISWIKYNPQQEIRQLHIPVLILQGTADLQVGVGDAESLKKAAPQATLQLISQMNHVFRQTSGDQNDNIATYKNPNLQLKPELVSDIVAFVQSGGQ